MPDAAPPSEALAAEVILAVPFDIDLELDVERFQRELPRPKKLPPLTGRNAPSVRAGRSDHRISLEGVTVAAVASEETWIYAFEIGLLVVRFKLARTIAALADLACDTEKLEVDGRPIYAWADGRAAEVRASLLPFALDRYEAQYQDRDVYPIVVLDSFPEGFDAGRWIEANRAAIVGVVGGEDDWARLSSFALSSSELQNLGYYKDELVLAKEWGALVSSAFEEDAIVGLILFAFAQRWALRSYNHLVNARLDKSYALLAEAKAFRGGVRAAFGGTAAMRRVSRSLFEAHEDRVHMLAAIRDFTSLPELTQDWHLHNLYQELAKTFYLGDLYKVVLDKNEELERGFAVVHDQLTSARMLSIEVWVVWLILLEGLIALYEAMRSR